MTIAEAYFDGLEKDSSVLGLGLGAALGHFGTNIALSQAMQGPAFLPDILRAGYQHGLSRRQVSPLREELATRAVGPELPYLYHEARKAGKFSGLYKRMEEKGPDYSSRLLDKLMVRAKNNPQLGEFLSRQSQIQAVLDNPAAFKERLQDVAPAQAHKARVQMAQISADRPALLEAARRAHLREKLNRPMTFGGRYFRGDPIRKAWQPATVPGGYQGPLVGGKVPKYRRYLSTAAKIAPEVIGVPAALAGVPVIGKPAGHMLLNKIREFLGRTAKGEAATKEWVQRAYKGKKGHLGMGPGMAGLPNRAVGILLSPGISELQEAAGAVGRVAKPLKTAVRRLAKPARPPAVKIPMAR